jgi:uncharacterized membrane protein YphA (DoxX/SURF4 family)
MQARSLLLLRVSLGLLILLWGIDKLINVEHAVRVSDGFYLGIFSAPVVQQFFGVLEIVLGVLVLLGLFRNIAYPALLLVTGLTLLGVWRSIIDPWGWFLEGSNVLFFPSLIVFAGALVMWAFRGEDTISVDARRDTV